MSWKVNRGKVVILKYTNNSVDSKYAILYVSSPTPANAGHRENLKC
jgi:hypothetical protein